MNEHEQQAEWLENYWVVLAEDATAGPPSGLDPEMAALVRRLKATFQPPEPEAAFAERLRQRLEAEAAARARRQTIRSPGALRRWRLAAGLAVAALLIVVLAGVYFWATQPPPVSAQEIIQKAQTAASALEASGIRSFAITETMTSRPVNERINKMEGFSGAETIRSETRRWYQAPGHWRIESAGAVFAPDGTELPGRSWRQISVSDGSSIWDYDQVNNLVTINPYSPDIYGGKGGLSPFSEEAGDLNALLQQASTCSDPKVTGSATVAGRPTYVIDLGPSRCPSASAPEMNGRQVIWVDKETFFVLKSVLYSPTDDQPIAVNEVTSIQVNIPLDPALFIFTPPPGAKVQDFRPKPAPQAEEYQEQLRQLAQQVDFPLFAPRYVPQGLVPLQPRLFEEALGNQVELSYVPAAEAGESAFAGLKGVSIVQQKASYSGVVRWTEGAQAVQIGDQQGWLRRSIRDVSGGRSNAAALVVRDGTWISVSSFDVSPEELVKIAASLGPVPGGHPPLPNPTPPTLAEIRQRVTFPVFVPTWVPEGLTPEPPVGGEQPGENVEIKYHTADGGVGLDVVNGTPDCCPGLLPLESEEVILPNGITARLIRQPTTLYGGMTLWWQQDGTTLVLSGPDLTQDDLVKIAASMSKTADLGEMERPTSRPTPTPLPPPQFRILRPTWLPEPMTVREEVQPGLPEFGSMVIIGFDPRPDDEPHEVLTLTEMPKAMIGPGGQPDPQARQEKIGDYKVTIIYRGQNCITLEWEVGDVHLTLTNPYDPPGQPRYTCEQLRQIVASIR